MKPWSTDNLEVIQNTNLSGVSPVQMNLGVCAKELTKETKAQRINELQKTDTFCVIKFCDIPRKIKDVCHASVVCEIRPGNVDPNRTRVTIGGGNMN